MTNAEFVALLWELRQTGLGSLDHAVAVCGQGASKWPRATTEEKWADHYRVDQLDDMMGEILLPLSELITPEG